MFFENTKSHATRTTRMKLDETSRVKRKQVKVFHYVAGGKLKTALTWCPGDLESHQADGKTHEPTAGSQIQILEGDSRQELSVISVTTTVVWRQLRQNRPTAGGQAHTLSLNSFSYCCCDRQNTGLDETPPWWRRAVLLCLLKTKIMMFLGSYLSFHRPLMLPQIIAVSKTQLKQQLLLDWMKPREHLFIY